MKLVALTFVQHSIDFEDVTVGFRPRELVPGTIEAKHEGLGTVGAPWSVHQ